MRHGTRLNTEMMASAAIVGFNPFHIYAEA